MLQEIPASKKSIAKRSPVYNIGVNDSDYVTNPKINNKTVPCPYYKRWNHMLERCYSRRYQDKYPTYKDCSVCDEWLTFSNFKAWMIKQDWQDMHLDKDILFYGNKLYSPNKCLFVTPEINLLITDKNNSAGDYPLGVSIRDSKRFRARCYNEGKFVTMGTFDTPEEASQAYKKFKSELVHKTALEQSEPLRSALIRISKEIILHKEA